MIKRTVFFTDGHSPFQDRPLWISICHFLRDLKLKVIDEIVFGGDMMDHYGISPFDKSPKRKDDVQTERIEFMEFMKPIIRSSGDSKKIYIEGNHERRWWKLFCKGEMKKFDNVPELQFNEFFGFNHFGIKIVERYKPNPCFLMKHGHFINKYPAKAELADELISGSSGHSHRTSRDYRRGHNGLIRWYSFGHTADKNDIDENCKFSLPMKWDQSFGLLLTDIKSNNWDMEVMHCGRDGFYSKYLKKRFKRGH